METEGSLTSPLEHATGSFREPDESIPPSFILFL